MENKIEISVLMPVYYKEKVEYFRQALDSIINQTVKPNQIVIIKDGKLTEQLNKTIEMYKNEYSQLIESYDIEKSNGLGNALKYGVKKCKYKYIARVDSDDISLPYRFEKQVKYLMSNPDIDILGGQIEEYDENMKQRLLTRNVPLTQYDINEFIKYQSPFNHGTVLMKKEAVIKSGNYNNTQFEDYDLWARMLIDNCKMANIDTVLCKNRTGKEFYKRRSGFKQVKRAIEIERRLLKYKIIDKRTYVKNIIFRTIFALTPVNAKKYLYKKYVRKEK